MYLIWRDNSLEVDDSKFTANNKFEMFLHSARRIIFNIRGWAFIRG